MLRFALVMLAVLVTPRLAFAQDGGDGADAGKQVKYKERTEIDFEEVDVNGELVKPEGSLLLDRKRASFNPLIRIRTDWDQEMKASVDEIK